MHKFSDYTHSIVTKGGKIYLPKALQYKCAKWYHDYLMHPGETWLEFTIGQHYMWICLCNTVISVIKCCGVCELTKKKSCKYGLLSPKPVPEIIPWHTLCINLIGPYNL